jgi:hypothetical protein
LPIPDAYNDDTLVAVDGTGQHLSAESESVGLTTPRGPATPRVSLLDGDGGRYDE